MDFGVEGVEDGVEDEGMVFGEVTRQEAEAEIAGGLEERVLAAVAAIRLGGIEELVAGHFYDKAAR